jgi:hypothetical protein
MNWIYRLLDQRFILQCQTTKMEQTTEQMMACLLAEIRTEQK